MNNIEIIIVEDDPVVSFLQKTLLKRHQISNDPLSFKNGKEALDFLLSDRSADKHLIILLDLNMPVMSGWEFLEKLKSLEIASRTKVVVVTSSTEKSERKKANQYDFVSAYIEKPLQDLTPIFESIERLKKNG